MTVNSRVKTLWKIRKCLMFGNVPVHLVPDDVDDFLFNDDYFVS